MISIFKAHQAGLRGDKINVVVKVQHPGIQDLMMIDIRNLQAFALDILKNDIKFDIFSITKKMEKQVFVLTLVSFALDILKNDIKFDIFSITKKMEKQVFVFTLVFLAKHIYPSFMYFLDYVNCEYRSTWIWISFFFCMSLIIYPLCCQY
ncbi:uncharacterized protein LOC108470834 [Gossypium arboreum]|uniref:uncharacterized protein LOC108470834 n=1 Tax=Gossypium arboreum TaxID=29729 RepID=UPI0008195593|nr:uncharacterized protein LOC108470834 [Gossypium arboreum]